MQSSSSWMAPENLNFPTVTSNFWSNGGYRKRKISTNDCEEKSQYKIFVTEDRLIKNMQTLSLDFTVNNHQNSEENDDRTDNNSRDETKFELHKLLKDNLRKDDLQDSLINKLCDFERKKLSMQIVPYMPIHPAQLNNNNNVLIDEKEQKNESQTSSQIIVEEITKENDDHLFKRPFPPTPYTVEEPCENITKRTPRMKRSYSQSVRSNSNLSVIELKNDTNNCSIPHSQSDYFIVEPTTPCLVESSTNHLNSSFSSIQISEYFDFPSSTNTHFSESFKADDIDMQSTIFSDITDRMDDDI